MINHQYGIKEVMVGSVTTEEKFIAVNKVQSNRANKFEIKQKMTAICVTARRASLEARD
jgi:hypothetical protein